MNERSQGGGVIDKGTIELMQNRRLLVDDNLGVDEPLNEENILGIGIQVIAKYYMHVGDLSSSGVSVQRETQLMTDHPMVYFFGMLDDNMSSDTGSGDFKSLNPNAYLTTQSGASAVANLKVHHFLQEQDR